jgi:hypothetical protein
MTAGYIYCFQNDSMPGIYKVGMTTREVEERLREANASNTWQPLPFTIVLQKRVNNTREAEKYVHRYLETYGQRVNKQREFFKISLDIVKKAFELVEQEADSCIICQEEGSAENYLIENRDCTCKYYYHEKCFPQERRKKCPLCSREIKREHVAIRVNNPPLTMSRLAATEPPTIPVNVSRPNQIPLLSSRPPSTNNPQNERKKKISTILLTIGIIAIVIFIIVTISQTQKTD